MAYKANYIKEKYNETINDPTLTQEQRQNALRIAEETFARWTDAEYNTAVARARTAKQFAEFLDPDRVEVFPNLRWLPSRSVTPRMQHQRFSGKVWPKDDPFWSSNAPGTEWNCKCDIEETDDPCTDNSAIGNPEPPRGLEGNPKDTGEIFTDRASYIDKQKGLRLSGAMQDKFPSLQKLVETNTKIYRTDYYSDKGGLLNTSRKRIEESKINSNEREKFAKEHFMCEVLARGKYNVDYLESVEGRYDILINGEPADLKKLSSENNIRRHASHAVKKQGAKIVVFEFTVETKEIHERLKFLKGKYHCIYFFSRNTNVLYSF